LVCHKGLRLKKELESHNKRGSIEQQGKENIDGGLRTEKQEGVLSGKVAAYPRNNETPEIKA